MELNMMKDMFGDKVQSSLAGLLLLIFYIIFQ